MLGGGSEEASRAVGGKLVELELHGQAKGPTFPVDLVEVEQPGDVTEVGKGDEPSRWVGDR